MKRRDFVKSTADFAGAGMVSNTHPGSVGQEPGSVGQKPGRVSLSGEPEPGSGTPSPQRDERHARPFSAIYQRFRLSSGAPGRSDPHVSGGVPDVRR